jgi:hypothetical protein
MKSWGYLPLSYVFGGSQNKDQVLESIEHQSIHPKGHQ